MQHALAGYRSCQVHAPGVKVRPVCLAGVLKCCGGAVWRLDRRWSVGAHADLCDLGYFTRVIWRRSGCPRVEGQGAKLETA